MTTDTDYVPIDCDQHSVLELLAMRRTPVVAQARQEGGEVIERRGEVQDVLTRDGAEYLVLLERNGDTLSIRLDRLLGLCATDGEALWRQKSAGA